jgi:hypothetical protein
MGKRTKLALSALAVGVLGSMAALGLFAAFSATSHNSGNEVVSGDVTLGDDDAGSALYFLPDSHPGDSVSRCIKVTYTGSLDSAVHLYMAEAPPGPLAPYVNVTITQGTQATSTFPDCSAFTPSAVGTIYDGTLADFATANGDYASGLDSEPAVGATHWTTGDSVVFRFVVTLDASAPLSAQSQSTGDHTYTWEARSL